MSYTITRESFESLAHFCSNSDHRLNWNSIFISPAWLKTWWQAFGTGNELHLEAVRQVKEVIGIAPLMIKDDRASLIGSTDVCDYLDFIIVPGREADFFNALLDDLRQKGINHLDLSPLRPDSTVLTHLAGIARNRGYEVVCRSEDISVELDLPATWEEYLGILATKQRHEVKRKLRRLSEAGRVDYHFIVESTVANDAMDVFLKMFTESRTDKAAFLTTQMESFFRSLANGMAEAGLLRLGVLELDNAPTAMTMCFDYNDCMYLYNSGYDSQYDSLSVGLLCKILSIKESIQDGKRIFDFLKGDEVYKYRLGGKEVPLYRCQITIR